MSGQPDITKFPGGQNAPADAPVKESVADVIVPAPEGNSVLVANPADRIIYYYSEGMAAPMGSFQNYRRKPRGLMVIDRSLREVSSGVYSTTTRLPKSGIYDVAFLLDSPRVTHCFSAEAKPDPNIPREKQVAIRIEYLNTDQQLRVAENYKLRFKVVDTTTLKAKSDLKDVRVLTMLSSGTWQKRDFARSAGDGIYELDYKSPANRFVLHLCREPIAGREFQTTALSLTLNKERAKYAFLNNWFFIYRVFIRGPYSGAEPDAARNPHQRLLLSHAP